MGLLDKIENGLERVVNGAFAKTFRSGVQPVEITAAIRTEMDTKATAISRDRVIAPSRFKIELSENDYNRIIGMGSGIIEEISDLALKYAHSQEYKLASSVQIQLAPSHSLSSGMLTISSNPIAGKVSLNAFVVINGKRHSIGERTVIGRDATADILINDPAASRNHLQLSWDGKSIFASDLGSTNGTKLHSKRIQNVTVDVGDELTIGKTVLGFRVSAEDAENE